jgi:hypothetical protein
MGDEVQDEMGLSVESQRGLYTVWMFDDHNLCLQPEQISIAIDHYNAKPLHRNAAVDVSNGNVFTTFGAPTSEAALDAALTRCLAEVYGIELKPTDSVLDPRVLEMKNTYGYGGCVLIAEDVEISEPRYVDLTSYMSSAMWSRNTPSAPTETDLQMAGMLGQIVRGRHWSEGFSGSEVISSGHSGQGAT